MLQSIWSSVSLSERPCRQCEIVNALDNESIDILLLCSGHGRVDRSDGSPAKSIHRTSYLELAAAEILHPRSIAPNQRQVLVTIFRNKHDVFNPHATDPAVAGRSTFVTRQHGVVDMQ
jgi:hypothetical protein